MNNNETIISDEVISFIEQRIDSVPHLEALLLIWESAPTTWTEEQLAARIYVDSQSCRKILRDLERRKLVRRNSDQNVFTYDPGNKFADSLPLVAQTYRRNLVVITRLIHSKGSIAVREFSRAFKFKKDN